MDYQEDDMTTNILHYAIEALGFDEQCIRISKNMEYHCNILRVTFLNNTLKHIEGVGGKFEGLELGFYKQKDFDNDDMDFVYYAPGIQIEKLIIAVNDLTITPVLKFPGYVYLQLPEPFRSFLPIIPNNIFHEDIIFNEISAYQEIKTVKVTQNGPAITQYLDFGGVPMTCKKDIVCCFLFNSWPEEANKWVTRNKPNNWPCSEMITRIKSKGFTLAPVGHYDSDVHKFQWRIGIRGEKELLSNLNHTQIMCYVTLKLILKGDIKLINEEALSSYHAKNVIFWCVEQEPCQWTKQNFEICLKTCINRLITFITSGYFPHYFIEDRKMINSKMNTQLKKKIVEVLTKYSNNILTILSISCFKRLKELTNFKAEFLECAKLKAVIERCISFYLEPFSYFYGEPHQLWDRYWGHNTDDNIKHAQDILYVLKNTKRHFIRHHIAYAKNMLGLLCYSRCNKTLCRKDILNVRKLIMSSLTFENISLKCRAATFLLMENDFTNCLNVCSSILDNPSKYKSLHEKLLQAQTVLKDFSRLIDIKVNDFTELTELKRKILTVFHDKCLSVKIGDERQLQAEALLQRSREMNKICDGCVHGLTRNDILKLRHLANETTHDAFLSVFENYTNLVFRDMSFNVPYLASEKWAVPGVIQYELLSVQEYHPASRLYGIYIDPRLSCMVLKCLGYQETNMLKQRNTILTTMNNYIKEYLKTDRRQTVAPELPYSLPPYRVFNIVAYCCIKAGSYKLALRHILKSFELYGYAQNTAFGYIRCVCGVLSSLYDN